MLAERMKNLAGSQTSGMRNKAKQLRERGIDEVQAADLRRRFRTHHRDAMRRKRFEVRRLGFGGPEKLCGGEHGRGDFRFRVTFNPRRGN